MTLARYGMRWGVGLHPLGFRVAWADLYIAYTPTLFGLLAAVLARRGVVVRGGYVVGAGWPQGAIVAYNTVYS
ncbi:hypothetical protein QN351_19630, partial [Cryobacterium sp. 10C2]|uniref:hypothetical protein n=1 Tax=Cryobacterium sp. 10C2 TaxID=3048576 RepID=UPI002B2281C3